MIADKAIEERIRDELKMKEQAEEEESQESQRSGEKRVSFERDVLVTDPLRNYTSSRRASPEGG